MDQIQTVVAEWKTPLIFLAVQTLVFFIFFYFSSPLSAHSADPPNQEGEEEDQDYIFGSSYLFQMSRSRSFSVLQSFSPAMVARLRRWARRQT